MRTLPTGVAVLLCAALGSGVAVAEDPADAGMEARPSLGWEAVLGEHRLWGELIVRAPMSRAHLDVLTDQVDRIWRPYGVTVTWREDPPPSLAPPGFSGWIRILIDRKATDHLQAGRRRQPAIAALHMPDGVPRNVIYVSLDGARSLLRNGGVGLLPASRQGYLVARMAGRAVAHELGHYLFQTSEHAAEGLMRAEFTRTDLLDPSLTRFRLTPVEAARLAERLFREPQTILARDPTAAER